MTKLGIWMEKVPEGQKARVITDNFVSCRGTFLIYNDAECTKAIDKHWTSDVAAIVPDMGRYVRDLTKYGPLKMGLQKVKALGVLNIMKTGFPLIPKTFKILAKDMKIILPILVQLDYLELRKVHPTKLFLHYQMTDLALANNNRDLIAAYLSLQKKYPHTELGLMTKNLTLLESKLREWDLYAPAVLAPFNSKGYGMRSSKKACEELLTTPLRTYYAYGVASMAKRSDELKYLEKIGIKRAYLALQP